MGSLPLTRVLDTAETSLAAAVAATPESVLAAAVAADNDDATYVTMETPSPLTLDEFDRDFVDLHPHCRCSYSRMDHNGHCGRCKLRNATYCRIVYEAFAEQFSHGPHARDIAHQMFQDERKMENEVYARVFRELSLNDLMDGGRVTVKQVVELVDGLTAEAFAAWVRRRNPLLEAIARPAVDRVIRDHFYFPDGHGPAVDSVAAAAGCCDLCAIRDFVLEPEGLRQRGEQYVLRLLDSSCGELQNSVENYTVVALNAAQNYVHDWLTEDLHPFAYNQRG
jgi:hypothetical protein